MSNKKKNAEKNATNFMDGGEGEKASADPKEKMAVVGGLLQELNSINQMMDSFIAAETEGLIICDHCYDTVFDDDENICTAEDEEGNVRVFCCAQCREEWKQQKRNKS